MSSTPDFSFYINFENKEILLSPHPPSKRSGKQNRKEYKPDHPKIFWFHMFFSFQMII